MAPVKALPNTTEPVLDPVRGAEANKRGPDVVVSQDVANASASQLGRGVVTVVPVTSSIDRVYPFRVLPPVATGLRHDSKSHAEQARSVAVQRVGPRIAEGTAPHHGEAGRGSSPPSGAVASSRTGPPAATDSGRRMGGRAGLTRCLRLHATGSEVPLAAQPQ